jgi:hypothetical protein
LLKLIVEGAGKVPQATVISARAVMVGRAAGLTVIVLDIGAIVLPQASVAVQVSVTIPPQAPGDAEYVDGFEVPLIRHPPVTPLLKLIVEGAGNAPQATVIFAGAVIVGRGAGLTVMVLDTGTSVLPQASIAVHVSVTVPPQAPGVVVNVEGLEGPVTSHPPVKPLV